MSAYAQGVRFWKEPKTANVSTGYDSTPFEYPPWGLVLRCVTRDDIPCTLEERADRLKETPTMKNYCINLTVLRLSNIGHGKAPFKKTAKGKPPVIVATKSLVDEAPVTQFVNPTTGQKTVVAARLFNFQKAMSSFDRGERMDDSSSILYVGETLRFGLSDFMYEANKKAFPAGMSVIPMGTIVEVVVTPASSGDSLEKGYGMKLTHVHVHESTLVSYNVPDSLGYFPSTLDDARVFASNCLEVGASIRMNVDTGGVTLFSVVSKSTYIMDIGDDIPYLRFSNDEGDIVPGIREADVHPNDLMRCLNCPGDIGLARTLADVACAAGAMKLFVYENKYFNRGNPLLSTFRCFPVLDSAALLSVVDADEIPEGLKSAVFPLDFSLTDTGPLGIRVSLKETSSVGGDKVSLPSVDVPIASAGCAFTKGYRFDVIDVEEGYSILEMYFLAFSARRKGGAAVSVGRTVYGRKRTFDSVDDDDA